MKSEHNNNGMPSPEDFWPEAKALLDNHFAKRKKIFLLFGMTLFFIISAIGFVFTNHKNNTTIAGLNKAKKEFKSNQLQPKNNTIKNIVKTKTELPFVNNSNEISTKLENQNIENKTDQKRNNFKNENLIIASTSKIENNRQSNTEAVKIDLSNTHQTVELPADNETVEAQRRTDAIVFSKMPFLSFKFLEQKTNHVIHENKYVAIFKDDDYFKNNNKFNYFIGAYGGIQSVTKQIKSDPTLTEYATIRNTSEKKINTIYFGVDFTVEKKNFLVQTGLAYNAIGEQNNYEAKSKQWMQNDEKVWDVYNKQIVKVDTVFHFGIVNYNQTIMNVKDSTLLTKSDSVFIYHTDSNIVKANGKTTINYLEIPLMIGYQFKFGKASIAPFGGISVGYLTKSEGMYINKTITGIEEINDANLITTFNLKYQLKLQLAYNLSDKIMFMLAPQFSNNLFSVSSKLSGISTKYSALGASFGINYKL